MEGLLAEFLLQNLTCANVSNGSVWAQLGPHFPLSRACPNLSTVAESRQLDHDSAATGCDEFLGEYKPTTGELLQRLGSGAQIPIILACFVEATLIILFLVEVCIIFKLHSEDHLRRWTLMVLASFPMDGLVNLVALLSPKGCDSILIYHFLSRCWLLAAFYFLSQRLVSNAAPQLAEMYQAQVGRSTNHWSFLCCMGPAKVWNWVFSKAQHRSEAAMVMTVCHLQAFPVLVILLMCSNALETSGMWSKLQVGTNWGPAEIFPLVAAMGYLTSLCGHLILLSSFRNFLDQFKYTIKLVCLEITTLTSAFWIIRLLLLKHATVPCLYPISSGILSKWLVFAAMQFILPLPATLAWFGFVQPLRESDKSRRSAIYTVCTTGLGTPPPTPSRIRADSMDRPLFPTVELELVD